MAPLLVAGLALVALGAMIGVLAGAAFRIQKDERAFRRDMDEARRRVRARREDMLV